jgi:methylisocitrate lyase
MNEASPLQKFRALMSGPDYIMGVGVWDPYTARICAALGVKCVHLGGYQLGATYCISEPLLTLTELADVVRRITAVIDIPLVVDAGAGFGEPLHVMRAVKELERAGAAGMHIEDQIYPKRVHYHQGIEHVIPRSEMVDKIKAAADAKSSADFVVIGRTDAMRTDGYAEGVERANLYLEAGAEMVMVFPNSLDEARRAPRDIKGHVAATNSEGNRLDRPTFSAREYQEMGYKFGSYPTALLCPVTQELKRVINHMVEHGESGLPQDRMVVWRKEVEDLIGLDELYRIERATVER